ncbi:MAG: TetR family transcriptional regulator [Acidobacteria bacterium]|nr:TetR family transcriptional regulator [Acidobacteriota bacterium]
MDATQSKLSNRERKKIEKRQRILDAAIKVIAKNGFQGTTVAEVASEAQVADGTIYLYFQNKDDLLITIFEETMDRFIADGVKEIAKRTSPTDKLRAIVDLHLSGLGSNEDLAAVFQIELRHSIHTMKQFSQTKLRDYFNIIEGVIEEAQRAGELRADLDPWTAVKVVFGALDEMATNWVLRKKEYALKDMAAPTIDILINGLK